MKKLLMISILLLTLIGCNSQTKNFGGSSEIELKKNEILLNITWKESSMWVLTKDTVTNLQYFREISYGVFEDEVVIK